MTPCLPTPYLASPGLRARRLRTVGPRIPHLPPFGGTSHLPPFGGTSHLPPFGGTRDLIAAVTLLALTATTSAAVSATAPAAAESRGAAISKGGGVQNPILFVSQFPIAADFATIGSTFANHLGPRSRQGRPRRRPLRPLPGRRAVQRDARERLRRGRGLPGRETRSRCATPTSTGTAPGRCSAW